MNKFLKDNEKVIEVYYKNNYGGFDTCNPFYYIVDKKLEIPANRIIALAPKPKDENEFNLNWVYINQEIIPEDTVENNFVLTDTEVDERLKRAKKPFFVAVYNLDSYFSALEKLTRKEELEKAMNKAAKSFEKVAKYRAMAELDPSIKAMFEEYIGLVSEENQNLLTEHNEN